MFDSAASHYEPGYAEPFLASPLRNTAPDSGHPLLHIRQLVDRACAAAAVALPGGEADRRCLRPARLIRAALLQTLYSYPGSEQLLEQLRYNTLYRWFVGLRQEEPLWQAPEYAQALEALRASEYGAALFRDAMLEAHAYAALQPGRFRVDQALLDTWTRAPGAASPDAARPSRLDRARAVILDRIGDSTLGPDQVAAELCMSRRALYLLFAKHGLTPTRAIREIRLDCCLKLLGDVRHRHRKITDIAMDFGFEHATSFSRQFKRRYGISPNAARAPARLATATPRGAGCEAAAAH